jgi:hypothetical protein
MLWIANLISNTVIPSSPSVGPAPRPPSLRHRPVEAAAREHPIRADCRPTSAHPEARRDALESLILSQVPHPPSLARPCSYEFRPLGDPHTTSFCRCCQGARVMLSTRLLFAILFRGRWRLQIRFWPECECFHVVRHISNNLIWIPFARHKILTAEHHKL